MAEGLAAAGATVVLAGRNATKGAAAVKQIKDAGGKAEFAEVDVTGREVLPRADRRRRGSGTASSTSWSTMPAPTSARCPDILKLEEWHTVMDTNLTSAFICTHAAYPHMKKAGGGKIINIGSMMTIFAAPLLAGLFGEQGRHRAVRALVRDRVGEGQHPGELHPAGLDQHRADQGARREVQGLNERVLGAHAGRALGRAAGLRRHRGVSRSAASDFVTGTAIPIDGGFSVQG